jgi:hypothetical protein
MTFRVTATRSFGWPDDTRVAAALQEFGLHVNALESSLLSFSDETDPFIKRYTEVLAANLADHLSQSLGQGVLRATTRQVTNRYCAGMDHHADLVLARAGTDRRLFFEIEFRPNFEKDLVKFRVGANSGRLAAGVLVVALDRRAVRGSYTTMPEFASVVCVVREFRPDHPLLVLGIEGVQLSSCGAA